MWIFTKLPEKENIEAVKQAIADGGDVNVKDKRRWIDFRSGFRLRRNGETPLHDAAYGGQKEIVELLIAEGADVHAKDHEGRTPLDMVDERVLPYEGESQLDVDRRRETANLLRKHGGKTGRELKAEGN